MKTEKKKNVYNTLFYYVMNRNIAWIHLSWN